MTCKCTTYTFTGMAESKGMMYAKRLSDGKEFFAVSMTRQGGINGIADDNERVSLSAGTYTTFRK